MYKQVRMDCHEAYSHCRNNLIVFGSEITYEAIVNAVRSAYSNNANDEELEFALFLKASDLNKVYKNPEFDKHLDPSTQREVIKYGYLGALTVTLSNGSEWPCHVYTDASNDSYDKFLYSFSILKMHTTEVLDVKEAVAVLKMGDDSILRKMVADREKQL